MALFHRRSTLFQSCASRNQSLTRGMSPAALAYSTRTVSVQRNKAGRAEVTDLGLLLTIYFQPDMAVFREKCGNSLVRNPSRPPSHNPRPSSLILAIPPCPVSCLTYSGLARRSSFPRTAQPPICLDPHRISLGILFCLTSNSQSREQQSRRRPHFALMFICNSDADGPWAISPAQSRPLCVRNRFPSLSPGFRSSLAPRTLVFLEPWLALYRSPSLPYCIC